jgi:hypothetical protein
MNRRFWRTLLWDYADRWLVNLLDWIAAGALLYAFLLILRLMR